MDLGVPELLIIAFIVVLLFGSKKLPGAAKSIGQSLRIFKDETKGLREDPPASSPTTAALPAGEPAAPVADRTAPEPAQPDATTHQS